MKYLPMLLFFLIYSSGYAQISEHGLMKHVSYLSSPELSGRLPGHEGYDKASEYSAGFFRQLGLKSAYGSDYYQYLNVEYNEITDPVQFSILDWNRGTKELMIGKDFVFRGFTGSGHITAEVVFCGYGISVPGYDDYSGIDVKGKTVMIFKQNPSWQLPGLTVDMSYPRYKANLAASRGAAAVVFVSKPNDVKPQAPIVSVLHGPGEQPENVPQLHLDLNWADKLLKKSGRSLSSLQFIIDSLRTPQSFTTGTTAEINVHARYYKEKRTQNIAAILEAKGQGASDEYIIVGAHFDHVGRQGSSFYAPGANDNASGSAAVLELAAALKGEEAKLKRSIIFVLFASEEQGLFGSKFMAENLPVPEEKITAMLNLDCIGYGDSIQIGNGKSAPILWNLINKIDEQNNNLMVNNTWGGGGADAAAFHDRGIPAAYFVTTNSYEHLHLPTDTPETLNIKLFSSLVNLAFETIRELSYGNYTRENVIKQ